MRAKSLKTVKARISDPEPDETGKVDKKNTSYFWNFTYDDGRNDAEDEGSEDDA